jgi:hypothetical protein
MGLTVILGVIVAAGSAGRLCGQEVRGASGDRLEGTVQKVDRENAIIFVAYDKVTREVHYDQATRFTVLNQPGSLAAVKEGRPVICRGKFDKRNRLAAFRVEVQEKEK